MRTSLAALLLFTLTPMSAASADDGPIGWAAHGAGTQGGQEGSTVEVSDAEALRLAVREEGPGVVRIRGQLRLTEPLRLTSHKTLLGVGADAALVGGGLQLRRVENIVVRNLTIRDAADAINVEESTHVWIDHCDLSRCHDGLIDIKRGSDWITVSWCHLHDHHKACLLGHSDKDSIKRLDVGHLRVTYHHNLFDGTQTRHPRIRFADPVHVFNNHFRGNEYGVASLMDAGTIVEGNYFERVEHPTHVQYGDSPLPGRLVERRNVYVESGAPETRGEVDERRLEYRYELDEASKIPELLARGAGVGKLGE